MSVPPPGRFRNLIFDLGGVLINLDYQRPIEAFRALSGLAEELAFNQKAQAPLFDALEMGQLSAAAFRAELRRAYAIADAVPDEALDAAWNAILLDLPAPRVALLRALAAAGYRLFLLSNTNEIHRDAFDRIIYEQHPALPGGLLELFERVYYSHEVGLRKPDAAIFRHVLTANGLDPAATLFIDDSPQHVAAAQQVGITALWLQPGQAITDPSPLLDALLTA